MATIVFLEDGDALEENRKKDQFKTFGELLYESAKKLDKAINGDK